MDAYQLARLSSTDRHRLGEVLDTQIGPKLLGAVDVHLAARVIKSQPIPRAAELLDALGAQQAVKVLRRFHHDLRDALLSAMPIERAKTLRSMLLWPREKIRIDPAVVSAPMIATIVDGTGLMIYFMVAHLTLPQLAGL